MMKSGRASVSVAVVAGLALLLTGCASSGVSTTNIASTENIKPIQTMPVASTNLPAIGETGAPVQKADLGQPTDLTHASIGGDVGGGSMGTGAAFPADGQPTQVADSGSFVTLDSLGSVPDAPGRDLTGGLTIEKLLGGWTIVSGAEQCKLNLTYTAKTGTSRYRASTPGCLLNGLKVVASWQLVGNQVQLFDENGDIVASLILSGNRFIGTLAGGQGISMVG